MRKRKIIPLIMAGAMMLQTCVSAGVYPYTKSPGYDMFEVLTSYASNLYIDENITGDYLMEEAMRKVLADKPELADELIKEAFLSLDAYSEYYTPEEYELFNKNINHIVYGIGVIIQKMGDYVTIMSVVDGGGASEAGVMAGDKISKVNGVDVKGESVDKVQDLVVGELGTQVSVTFIRGSDEFTRTITRQEVTGNTVAGGILAGNIGYIEIVNFAAKTDTEFAEVLQEFDEQGVKDVIIDLRNNPGGYMDSAIRLAQTIVPEGTICSAVFRNEEQNEVFLSGLKETKYNLVVLVNENTASAAELLASAIKDSGAGFLIGTKTYGKGVIQQMFQMMNGSAFKLTTGKYFTRSGEDINGIGVEPNEGVINSISRIDVSRYSTFDYKEKPAAGGSSKNVYAAKERLRIMGLYTGSLDEYFDAELDTAVREFQKNNGLYPYGVLDISTQVKIENTFYKLEEEIDDQFYAAYEYFGGKKEDLFKK